MRLSELYRSGRPAQTGRPEISIEFFPPKTPEGIEKLFEVVERLKRVHPVFFSMTYGAAGSTRNLTLDLCDRLKNKAEAETTCHLNIIGQSKEETRENLRRLKSMGIYNLLALRGDPPRDQPDFKPHPEGFTSSVELIEEAHKVETGGAASSKFLSRDVPPSGGASDSGSHKDPWFSIAVTGFPEVHPEAKDRASDIAYLKRKIEAGGCVVITQLFFDNAYFFEFLEHLRKAGITVPVIPGILPILSVPQVRRFAALAAAKIPPAVDRELAKYETDDEGATRYGIELSTRMCEGLLKGGVSGLHFYSLNRPHSTEAILSNLRLA